MDDTRTTEQKISDTLLGVAKDAETLIGLAREIEPTMASSGMSLWILEPIDEDSRPWDPWYEKAFGYVVRAMSEERARQFASEQAGDEGMGANSPWLDPSLSRCQLLTF